jgi:uncharacterized protein (TIGR03083 family)
MEISEYVEVLDREGRLLAATAGQAGVDAKVPTCPDWQVRKLLRHTGMVHRWATAFVTEGHRRYHRDGGEPDLDGEELLEWFREGHTLLVAALRAAPPDLECWTFMPGTSPLAFWARRQAHETTVHRVDAESALGEESSPIGTDLALDGIDELLCSFHARERSKVRTESPAVLRIRATDADPRPYCRRSYGVWSAHLSERAPRTVREDDGPADCELAGPAERLYLALWNRGRNIENRGSGLTLTGDASLIRLWRDKSAIAWS